MPSCLWFVLSAAPAYSDDSVLNSKHDLSVSGPGPARAVNESQVCIFCHAPHNASPAAPLWNRHSPTTHYRVYSSSTTDARIDQPSGASKLCLSCHDGSIALGTVLSRPPTEPIPMTHLYMPTGRADLTNDLSDDHPIGLRYDRSLSNRDPQLRSPDVVSRELKLGPRGELDCVACHDPHNNEFGDFLRIPMRQAALCTTCHSMDGWRTSSHALSPRTVPITLTGGERLPFNSMADNGCASCHTPHGAPHAERLLRDRPSDLCIACHDGINGRDILSVQGQRTGHQPDRVRDVHDPAEDPRSMRPHVECVDCHNPHAVMTNPLAITAGGPAGAAVGGVTGAGVFVPPALQHVPGVSLAGARLPEARFYHEVCFRCHADNPVPVRQRIVRQRDDGGNIRRQFLPTAASAHPVGVVGRSRGESPSLRPELRNGRTLSCQDCHNNPDARQLGGGGANGPHGSRHPFLLAQRYETADFTSESAAAYVLCYQCHDRTSILADESFSLHRVHVVNETTPCSACHAPHGVTGSSAEHGHLINFDLSIVGGERQFVDTGRFTGNCTLTCHGVRHVAFRYAPTMP